MARFGAKKTSGGRNIYLSVIIFLLLIFLFLSAIHSLSSGSLEEQQKKIEEKFSEAIEIARTSGISLDKLAELLTLMYQEDE